MSRIPAFLAVRAAILADDVIAHGVGDLFHWVRAPAKRIAAAVALAADPAPAQVFESAGPRRAARADQTPARRARVGVVNHAALGHVVFGRVNERRAGLLDVFGLLLLLRRG